MQCAVCLYQTARIDLLKRHTKTTNRIAPEVESALDELFEDMGTRGRFAEARSQSETKYHPVGLDLGVGGRCLGLQHVRGVLGPVSPQRRPQCLPVYQ